jgi:transposase
MTLRPQPVPPLPEATAAAVQAACPQGTLSVALRAECGALSAAQVWAELSPPQGRPVDGAPWRLALVLGRPDRAGLTARQAAAAVRRGREGQSALRLA